MSTRCHIGFYRKATQTVTKPDALIYRHSDGYPGTVDGKDWGVLTDLVPFLELFQERRGLSDSEYASAWALHHLIDLHIKRMCDFYKTYEKKSPWLYSDGKDCLGYGISDDFHGDIEYHYAVYPNRLEVYEVSIPWDSKRAYKRHFSLIDTIYLDNNTKKAA